MSRTFVYSDPHFYHKNIVTFVNYDGTPVRPWDDAEEMAEDMIRWYNELVQPEDRVYLLGDIAFSKNLFRKAVSQLSGRKVLVMGNHDPVKAGALMQELGIEVRGYVVKKGFIMSHMPIHPHCMGRWKINIHGHTHNNVIKIADSQTPDPRYYNACVERTNFRPKLLDDILKETNLVTSR